MQYCIGIDIGSRNTKIVVLDTSKRQIAFSDYSDTGINPIETVDVLLEKAKSILEFSNEDIARTYCTGYGRNMINSDKVISEISCHSYGIIYENPEVRTIIDIGGQDSKIISLDDNHHILDFAMNDKCAAGTGRFLEMIALRIGVPCSELSNLASQSNILINLNNTCVVFAESEIIGLIAKGMQASDIARAVNLSIASRIKSQLNQLHWKSPVAITGGVAFNDDLRRIIGNLINTKLLMPTNPEITGALGAAIIAAKEYEKN